MNLATAVDCLDALSAALEGERQALLARDVQRLLQANEEKLAILAALEANPPPVSLAPRLAALGDANRANGALLARRRREVDWALRYLGRHEALDSSYDARGQRREVAAVRCLASA